MELSPKQVEWISTQVGQEQGHRLMIIFSAPGCAFAFASGGCTNCSFPQSFGVRHPVSRSEYLTQLEEALSHIPQSDSQAVQLDLFVSGSFFNRGEVPPQAQTSLLSRASQVPRVHRIVVESRPEYISPETIERALHALGPKGPELEVALGLESADELIREQRIRKGFTWEQFEQAARILAQQRRSYPLSMFVYLLLKPMSTAEGEALEDLVLSARKVFSLAQELSLPTRVGLEPCFVGPDTVLEKDFESRAYRPPWLWSMVEAVQRIAPLGPIKVGLSDEGLNPQRAAHNCSRCNTSVLTALADFNSTQDPAPLADLDCTCRAQWLAERGPASDS